MVQLEAYRIQNTPQAREYNNNVNRQVASYLLVLHYKQFTNTTPRGENVNLDSAKTIA